MKGIATNMKNVTILIPSTCEDDAGAVGRTEIVVVAEVRVAGEEPTDEDPIERTLELEEAPELAVPFPLAP